MRIVTSFCPSLIIPIVHITKLILQLYLKNSKKQSFQHTMAHCLINLQVFNQCIGSVGLGSRINGVKKYQLYARR
jgi:hypothetical protein